MINSPTSQLVDFEKLCQIAAIALCPTQWLQVFFWQLRFFYRNCWPAKTIVIVAQQTVSSFRNMRPPLLSSHPPLFWSVSSSSAGSLVKRQQRDSCIFPSISPPHSPMSFPSLVPPPFLSSTTPTLPSSSPRNSKYQQQAVVPKQWNCSVGA